MRKGTPMTAERTLRLEELEQFGTSRSDALALHRFASDHTVTIHPTQAVCTFIPKNACSTLRYSILLANGVVPDPDSPNFRNLDVAAFRSTPVQLASAPYTFIIVRCPYRRLVSMFLDKMLGSGRGLSYILAYNLLGRRAERPTLLRYAEKILRHSGRHSPVRQHELSFRDVVSFLEKPGALLLDHHWRPQNDFLIYERYDGVFCVEELAMAEVVLRDRLGFTLVDARELTGHGTDRTSFAAEGFYGDTPISILADMKGKGVVPSFNSFFDDEIRARVTAIYSRDIDLYQKNFGNHGLLFQ